MSHIPPNLPAPSISMSFHPEDRIEWGLTGLPVAATAEKAVEAGLQATRGLPKLGLWGAAVAVGAGLGAAFFAWRGDEAEDPTPTAPPAASLDAGADPAPATGTGDFLEVAWNHYQAESPGPLKTFWFNRVIDLHAQMQSHQMKPDAGVPADAGSPLDAGAPP